MAAVNGRCRSCAAPVIWAKTATGTNMPLDAEPGHSGLFDLEVMAINRGEHVGGYTSHFATCPDAAKHRVQR